MKSTRKELVQASLDKIFIEKRCLIRQLLADPTPSESKLGVGSSRVKSIRKNRKERRGSIFHAKGVKYVN